MTRPLNPALLPAYRVRPCCAEVRQQPALIPRRQQAFRRLTIDHVVDGRQYVGPRPPRLPRPSRPFDIWRHCAGFVLFIGVLVPIALLFGARFQLL